MELQYSNFPDLLPEDLEKAVQLFHKQGIQFYQEKQIFNISLEEFKELVIAQVDITALYILQCVDQGIDIVKELPYSKVKGWFQTLQRKGYVTQDGKISETGKEILDLVRSGKPVTKELKKIEAKKEDDFDKWWLAFPSNDIFTYQGKTFKGSRTLRVDQTKCRILFERIIGEGEYTVDDLIRSLKYEVQLKMELSVKENDNKMRYLSASTAYLNQRKFEGFMESSKNAPVKDEPTSSQYGGYDI